QATHISLAVSPLWLSGTYRTWLVEVSSRASVPETAYTLSLHDALPIYCQAPLPVLPVMAIPFKAPLSTSAQEAEVRIVLAVVPLDVVSSLVQSNLTFAPFLVVGASLTLVTVIEAVAVWLE